MLVAFSAFAYMNILQDSACYLVYIVNMLKEKIFKMEEAIIKQEDLWIDNHLNGGQGDPASRVVESMLKILLG
jgi:hypothetical protein